MTKRELLRAFEMRMDGLSFADIGERLHYSAANVEQAMKRVMQGCTNWNRSVNKIVYPEITAYIKANDLDITKLYCLTRPDAYVTPYRFYRMLYGLVRPNDGDVVALTELLGKPYKEVFRRDDA